MKVPFAEVIVKQAVLEWFVVPGYAAPNTPGIAPPVRFALAKLSAR